jgi:hypothetical protein
VTNTFQSLNRYAYVLNNPTTLIDPLGLGQCPPGYICVTSWSSPYGSGGMGGWGGTGDRAADPVLVYAPTITHNGAGTGTITVVTKPGSIVSSFGIKTGNQTFNQCMAANSTNYSIGGAVDLAFQANGVNLTVGESLGGQVVAGNIFTGLYGAVFGGSASDAVSMGASEAPDIVKSGMGTTLTWGRRTSSIMSLNLGGTPGGPPLALSPAPATGEFKSLLGSASKALNLGMEATTRGAVDAGFFLAEAFGCSIHN